MNGSFELGDNTHIRVLSTILVYEYSCHILVLYKLGNKMTMKMYFWLKKKGNKN
jgi:hypothetical protein